MYTVLRDVKHKTILLNELNGCVVQETDRIDTSLGQFPLFFFSLQRERGALISDQLTDTEL